MSNTNPRKAGQLRAQIVDALGSAECEYEFEDGTKVSWPWLFAMSNEQKEAIDAIDGFSSDAEFVEALLGKRQAATFKRVGGDVYDLALAWRESVQRVSSAEADVLGPTR